MTAIRLGCALLVLALVALAGSGCSSTPNRVPLAEAFPAVAGTGLDGQEWSLPDDLEGAPALLLVGYVQEAQFDGDRWLLGLMQADVQVRVLEVPTIDGMLPGMFAGAIDNGMRRGIPEEDWATVVTVYGDAGDIVALTGNENPNNMRVILLDAKGDVVWFHDRGYSAGTLMELKEALAKLGQN
jgi:hypothetical protein